MILTGSLPFYNESGKDQEWKILGDLAEAARRNQGMEKLFQEKVI